MNYGLFKRLSGVLTRINLLSSQFLVYDFSYTDQRKIDFPHAHPFHEFYFLLQGGARIQMDQAEYQLQAGDMLHVAPGSEHHFILDSLSHCGYLNVAFDICYNSDKTGGYFNQYIDFPECVDDERFLITNLVSQGSRMGHDSCGCWQEIDHIVTCLEQTYLGDVIKIFSYMSCFFIAALQNFSEVKTRADFPQIDQNIRKRLSTKAIDIAQYIWEHSDEDLSIEQVAQALNYSKRSIQRILADYYSVGFSTLLSHYRVARLKAALRTGTDTLESFSARCGYHNTRGLSRHFQEITGMTVAQFKQNTRQFV